MAREWMAEIERKNEAGECSWNDRWYGPRFGSGYSHNPGMTAETDGLTLVFARHLLSTPAVLVSVYDPSQPSRNGGPRGLEVAIQAAFSDAEFDSWAKLLPSPVHAEIAAWLAKVRQHSHPEFLSPVAFPGG